MSRVYGEHGVRGLDDLAEEDAPSSHVYVHAGSGGRYASGVPVSTQFHLGSGALPGSDGADNLGHYRAGPTLAQSTRAFPSASLEGLQGFKVRDLFSSHAARVALPRAEVVKQTESELYVPRQAALLQPENFTEFNAAAAAYAATMANTTANARAKAAARAAKLGGTSGATAAGAGGGSAALVAAATASAIAAADLSASRPVPLIPQSHDPVELARAQATEAYLQEVWSDNRAKAAADDRLRKHISKLVGDWAGKLARFEEEVARRQEDTYYAKFRRAENAKLAQSMGSLPSREAEEKQQQHPHRTARESPHEHHHASAYSSAMVGKVLHQDPWAGGTELTVLDPKQKAAQARAAKEAARKQKALQEHQMAQSICASTLAAPQGPTVLQALLARTATTPYGSSPGADQTTPLSFSSFRPVTSPMGKTSSQAADASSSPPSARPHSSTTLPSILALHAAPPAGLSIRQPRPAPFAGIPGHGNPGPGQGEPPAHVFATRSVAQAAAIGGLGDVPTDALGTGLPPAHVSRRADLLAVERIKDRLAAAHISVPRGVLERALVAPEVRLSADFAQASLPTAFFNLPPNPFANEKKGKKGGKKGKGSKKKK